MELGTAKKIALALIEEYAKGNDSLTDDEDIRDRLNLLFNAPYQELARIRKISTSHTLDRSVKGTTKYYREYDLPTDMYQLKNIVIKDNETKEVLGTAPDYYIEGKKIYVNDLSDGDYVINYFKFPSEITENTKDDVELELDQDACTVLPYAVASDILKSDISSDYSSFEMKYLKMIKELDNKKDLSIKIGKI